MFDERGNAAFAWLSGALADPANELSFGAFGAIGLFRPDGVAPGVSLDERGIIAESAAASLRLERRADLHPVAFEILSSDPARWNHGVALCVPEHDARMAGRTALTPLGRDHAAIHAGDRGSEIFDLGLAIPNADICVRATADAATRLASSPGLTANARAEAEIMSADLDWIFVTALGRLEIRNPAARFLMPQLIDSGRTHAVTTPIPTGLAPCGYLFPPNPSRVPLDAPFDLAAHERFQAIFRSVSSYRSRGCLTAAPISGWPAPSSMAGPATVLRKNRSRSRSVAICGMRKGSSMRRGDLSDPEAATPIVAGCKVCEREICVQRAFPFVGRPLVVDEIRSMHAPYAVS